ncbi:Lrp/AsnC family transcriptional regulator [Xanthocytophaga agilis]|uniref:Lrp/AsnC family transcriptional regulator n=1 Tax=Xanthocytophaga agilis TaxID=3048010 RepID=A0AAE3UEM6_9BACT|nr:Lrp/AsnC family transcriptional regulator [Xanthocytophaga agilis]MDJ1502395.1 Lrp/AsnC family transcriptional regulator [Xanthocytophaga agilis]
MSSTYNTTLAEHMSNPALVLDSKDYEILRLLQENAKSTVREIAAKVHLSTTPVHDRIKRMENNGVIKQYAALVDRRLVRKGIMVICYVSLKEHTKKVGGRFIEAILQMRSVIECYTISGEFDFMLKIIAESMDDYHTFYINELSEIKGIRYMQSIFVMNVIKDTHQII